MKRILAEELAEQLLQAEATAKTIKLDKRNLGETVFVYQENQTFINPKYISLKDYFSIFELEKFLKKHDEITREELNEILKLKFAEFEFLRKLNNRVRTMFLDLKHHGAKAVAITYVSNKLYANEEVIGV